MTSDAGAVQAHRWAVFGASIRGPAHARDALPNQDAVAWRSDDAGRWAVTAVADGHGHSLAVRAERGSRLAVEVAVDVAGALGEGLSYKPGYSVPATMSAALPASIADGWLASVRGDLRAHPLLSAELERSGNSDALSAHPALAYGTTLITSLAAGRSIIACQIGDGDLLGVNRDGTVFHLLPTDVRLVGTRTTSLASETAFTDFRSGHLDTAGVPVEMLVAASDGYVNSFSAEHGFLAAGRDLWKLTHESGPTPVAAALTGWLESTSADGTGDDATVAVLYDTSCFAGACIDRITTTSTGWER